MKHEAREPRCEWCLQETVRIKKAFLMLPCCTNMTGGAGAGNADLKRSDASQWGIVSWLLKKEQGFHPHIEYVSFPILVGMECQNTSQNYLTL